MQSAEPQSFRNLGPVFPLTALDFNNFVNETTDPAR